MSDNDAELGHVQIEAADLERSVAFYTGFLGFEVSERMESRKGRVVLLSGGDRHREVVLRAAPPHRGRGGGGAEVGRGSTPDGDGGSGTRPAGREDAPGDAAGRRVGADGASPGGALSAPFQVGFELPDRRALADLFFELRREQVPTTAVDHGVSWSVYFRDPDGNALEAYWDTRAEQGGRDRWDGRSSLLAVDQILSEERVAELTELLRQREEEAAGDTEDEAADARDDADDAGEAKGGGDAVDGTRDEASGNGNAGEDPPSGRDAASPDGAAGSSAARGSDARGDRSAAPD